MYVLFEYISLFLYIPNPIKIHYNNFMYRFYIERKEGFRVEANRIYSEINSFLGISGVTEVRYLNRYDIENVSEDVAKIAATRIFSEPQSDFCAAEELDMTGYTSIIWEYLPGQYDQRADSAEQCLLILRAGLAGQVKVGTEKPIVRCGKIVLLKGDVTPADVEKIQKYLINPVDSRLTTADKPATLKMSLETPGDIPVVEGFLSWDESKLHDYREKMGLAMDDADVKFLQDYFKTENRDPTETEIRVLDTYWSDHCRHTTFNTILDDIKIDEGEMTAPVHASLEEYKKLRDELYGERAKKGAVNEKPLTLMDMACIGAKYLKKTGHLDDIELSEEINACSIYIDVDVADYTNGVGAQNGKEPEHKTERWLLQFKNETHNHPTEIEPFGGAATCIGGAIRDPLSGRAWVYQSLRVTGAADPTVPLSATREGKLPQMKLTREAAQGFSSYGNQIGLTTGQVCEMYHPGFEAKRMELGAVIAAVPADCVKRETPDAGDCVVLVGGGTGRDGIGGATGSSKAHTVKSVTTAAAEVQKGNAVEERKIQRFFRNRDVANMIRRCNDFGAGGVSVAVGELAPGLDINLDAVPKKYEGLNGTEIAISESQERMAIVVREKDVQRLIDYAHAENLDATLIAKVTDTNRLVMNWRGKKIVDISREFIDTNGAYRNAEAHITCPVKNDSPLAMPLDATAKVLSEACCCDNNPDQKFAKIQEAWYTNMKQLATCSQRGLSERFDGSIGASSVLFPFGGKYQATPESGCAAKIPVNSPCETETTSLMTFGYDPRIAQWSPYHGAQTSVLYSLARIIALGGNPETCRLTFQEYFERTSSKEAWGKPAAALLGALTAQTQMKTASIGGKDSMSGTFGDITVPPTLVSFAVTIENCKNINGGSFKSAGNKVYFVPQVYTSALTPDFADFTKKSEALYELNKAGKLSAMYPVGAGGIADSLTKMAFGNRIGVQMTDMIGKQLKASEPVHSEILESNGHTCGSWMLFCPLYGALIVEVKPENASAFESAMAGSLLIGETISEPEIRFKKAVINLCEAEKEWESVLAKVFPPIVEGKDKAENVPELPEFAKGVHKSLSDIRKNPTFNIDTKAKPRVILPVFPGTNCELDMERAFKLAGADTKVLVIRNKTADMLEESLKDFESELKKANILALSGGFSAGDEPDGSAKFIANILKEGRISNEVMNLIKNRDGLILGICNGFQALIKTGLVPYGEIREMDDTCPTLTYNNIGRHISRIARTRIVSAATPWAMNPSVIDERNTLVAISHGEGRIVVSEDMAKQLFANGQVFTQYVNENGVPVMTEPDNPNGSAYAIEGLISPDGRVLGKMGHNERSVGTGINGCSDALFKNVAYDPMTNTCDNSNMNLFRAGVCYFK